MATTFRLAILFALALAGLSRAADPAPAIWAVGSKHVLKWDAARFTTAAQVTIELSPDGGKTWTLTTSGPNTGRLVWTVPDQAAGSTRLRVHAGKPAESIAVGEPFAIGPSQEVKDYEWVLVNKAAPFAPRDGAGALTYKGRMWFIGGDVNQGHYHSDVWHSTDGKNWTLANPGKPVPWGPRALHYTVTFRDKIWVMGGQTVPQFAKSDEVFHRDIWNSADGVTWERVVPKEPFWPQRGMIGGSVVHNDRMWLLGGGTYDTPKLPDRKFFNDVWSSADGVRWTRHVEEAPWPPRQYHDVAVFDGRMWVLEGYHKTGGNRKDVWYSADGLNWYEVPNTPWAPRHAASVYVHDGGLWVIAGNNMQSDVWKLRRKPGP